MPLLWINKTASSASLSHSDSSERLQLLSQAQRTSRRRRKAERLSKSKLSPTQKAHPALLYTECQVLAFAACVKPTLSSYPDWTDQEQRGIRYFYQTTAPKIVTLHSDGVFWKDLLPQTTELYPALRHLVVAIASTHELLENADANGLNEFALEQCNKATRLLRNSTDLSIPLLLVSCILVSAYHLLRCDMLSADKTVESGLRIASSYDGTVIKCEGKGDAYGDHDMLKTILSNLSRNHGFKLWSPDIAFRFHKSTVSQETLEVDVRGCVKGPFVDSRQILDAYKSLMFELVLKVLRNLAGGAHVDPHCSFAQETSRQLGMFSFYWDEYYSQLGPESEEERIEAQQLRVGLYSAYILFHAKIIAWSDMEFDTLIWAYGKIVDLAEGIIEARFEGRSVIYLDRIVNGALFTLGLCCRDPLLRRRAIALLQSQCHYEDGLVNWLRGLIISMIVEVEEQEIDVKFCGDIPLSRRIHLGSMHCRSSDKAVRLEYTNAVDNRGVNVQHVWRAWIFDFGDHLSPQDIDDCLQGMMATYLSYGKADAWDAPHGYVRPMVYRGRPIPVHWEEGRNLQGQL